MSLIAIYMAIFLVDELALFAAIVLTMRATRLEERHGRVLRLVTGSVMLCLAAVMILDPTMLEEVRVGLDAGRAGWGGSNRQEMGSVGAIPEALAGAEGPLGVPEGTFWPSCRKLPVGNLVSRQQEARARR